MTKNLPMDEYSGLPAPEAYGDKVTELDDPKRLEFEEKRNYRLNCDCLKCLPIDCSDARTMYKRVCPSCRNKKCLRAENHENACINSNASGQEGSIY